MKIKIITLILITILLNSCDPASKSVMIVDCVQICNNCTDYKYIVYIKDEGFSATSRHKVFTNEEINAGDTIKLTK